MNMTIKELAKDYFQESAKVKNYVDSTLLPYIMERNSKGTEWATVEIPVWYPISTVVLLLSEYGIYAVKEDGKRLVIVWGSYLA